jgi:hypothetical protein
MKIKTLLRLKHMGLLIVPLAACNDDGLGTDTFSSLTGMEAESGETATETGGMDVGDGDGDAGDGDGDAGDGDGDAGDGDGDAGDGDGDAGDGDGDTDGTCMDGQTQPCYTGLPGTQDVGDCQSGTQTCVNGEWDPACVGEVLPQLEMCDNHDDDCDGMIDDGITGDECFAGGLGACAMGVETCVAGEFQCMSTVQPSMEICFNNVDEDCNGQLCCPYVYAFDGRAWHYESSVGGAALVGLERQVRNGKGRRVRFAPLWVRLDSASILEDRSVKAEILASEDEIVYLDHVGLTAIHHPIGHEVISSSAIQWTSLRRKDPRQFWAFPTARCRVPARASWCGEVDQTEVLSQQTGTPAAYDHQRDNFYDFDFGEVQDGKRAWLLIDSWKFKRDRDLPKHLRGRKPTLEILQPDGSWQVAKQLATPRGDRKAIAVDLSGMQWPTGSYQMRIWTGTHEGGKAMWYLDRVRLVEATPAPLSRSHVLISEARLEFRGLPTLLSPEHDDRPRLSRNDGGGEWGSGPETYGRFTRYGDVTSLVKTADDRVVVMRQGDVVTLRFEHVPEPPPGYETSLFLRTNLVYKRRITPGATAPTPFTENVEPMPCRQMERYTVDAPTRSDAEYLQYLAQWNTREYLPGMLSRSAA